VGAENPGRLARTSAVQRARHLQRRVRVLPRLYTVPSRLVGRRLRIRQYQDRIEPFLTANLSPHPTVGATRAGPEGAYLKSSRRPDAI
jgi:hypothetical protein